MTYCKCGAKARHGSRFCQECWDGIQAAAKLFVEKPVEIGQIKVQWADCTSDLMQRLSRENEALKAENEELKFLLDLAFIVLGVHEPK